MLSFIGFSIIYSKWLPYFAFKIAPLQELIKEIPTIDTKFRSNVFNNIPKNSFDAIISSILKRPISQYANKNKMFYLKTKFSSIGLGFAL